MLFLFMKNLETCVFCPDGELCLFKICCEETVLLNCVRVL